MIDDRQTPETPAAPPGVGLQRVCSERRVIGRPWRKGQSGNPAGRRRGTVSIAAALKRLLTREEAEAVARKLIGMAKDGDLQAMRLLCDRVDGPQTGPLAALLAGTVSANEAVEVRVNVAAEDLPC